jgi:hypothetical protein
MEWRRRWAADVVHWSAIMSRMENGPTFHLLSPVPHFSWERIFHHAHTTDIQYLACLAFKVNCSKLFILYHIFSHIYAVKTQLNVHYCTKYFHITNVEPTNVFFRTQYNTTAYKHARTLTPMNVSEWLNQRILRLTKSPQTPRCWRMSPITERIVPKNYWINPDICKRPYQI